MPLPSRGPSVRDATSADGNDSFAQLIAGLPERAGSRNGVEAVLHSPEVESAGRAANEVRIGDDAIRFDAKAIVAPSGAGPMPVRNEPDGRACELVAPIPAPAASQSLCPNVEQVLAAGADLTSGPAIPMQQAQPTAHSRVRVNLARHFSAAAGLPSPGGIGPRAARFSIDFPRMDAGEVPTGQPLRRAVSTPDTSAIFARLVAIDGSYRVRTRGAALTPGEADKLSERIRAALREYGLADRPVTISTTAGAA